MISAVEEKIRKAVEKIEVGCYLTDGRRLVQVRRAEPERVVAEEGPVSTPDIVSLSWLEIATEWRLVRPLKDGDDAEG